MGLSVKLPAIYYVREDNGCWGVMRGREQSFGWFRRKDDAVRYACDEAQAHAPSIVSVERASGQLMDEFRFDAQP